MRMKKIDIGQLVQTLANVGVIASIVFLAIQVQQNSNVQRAQARALRAQIRIDGSMARATNPELLAALMKQRRGEPRTEIEEMLLEVDARVALIGWQYIYGEFREGLIEDVDVPIEDWRRAFSRNPSFARIWQQDSRVSFRPDFAAWMNENVVPSAGAPNLSAPPADPQQIATPTQ
jgi:hypothetical protein